MTEDQAIKLLRCDDARLVDILLSMVNLTWKEEKAVNLCGRQEMTQFKAAEILGIDRRTIQKWNKAAMVKICKVWGGVWWIQKLID